MTYRLGLLPLTANAFSLRSLPLGRCLVFLDDGSRVFVFSKCDKARMAEMVVGSPFQKPELRDSLGTEPYAVFHLCGC